MSKSWKGHGINQNPIGYAPGHIRPLTNKDPGNIFPAPFGKPRPLKQYRKGNRNHFLPDGDAGGTNSEKTQVMYNVNRFVTSSLGTALGQGRNGGGLLSELMEKPGAYFIKQTPYVKEEEIEPGTTCQGVKVMSNYSPNLFYLTENPVPQEQTKAFCCNEERKARRRVVYANTNLPSSYYTTHGQYMQHRCQTFDQKSYHFLPPTKEQRSTNTYLANCQATAELHTANEIDLILFLADSFYTTKDISEHDFQTLKTITSFPEAYAYIKRIDVFDAFENSLCKQIDRFLFNRSNLGWNDGFTRVNGCKLTVYKPNNSEFAVQGAVASSTKNLQLNVSTIQSNAASFRFNNNVFLKNKETKCNPSSYPYQNTKTCNYTKLPSYSTPNVQPSPYRFFYSPM